MPIIDTTFLTQRLSGATSEQDSLRVIVFALTDGTASENANYLLAFPAGAVLKIITYPSNIKIVENGIGVADWGEQAITIVDLRQKFFPPLKEAPFAAYRFLILLQTQSGELCGFPVEQSPFLIDLPSTTIRPVPLSYRQVGGLSFASHMAILPQSQGKDALKIFLLAN